MSFLSGFVSESNHHHSGHKRASKRNKFLTDVICDCAFIFGVSLFILALIQLFITLLLNVSSSANLFDVYSRNSSSIICLVLIGIFLIRWYYFNIRSSKSDKGIVFFKVIVIVTAAFCLVKGLLSIYYLSSLAYRGIYVIIYYAGDVLAWCTVAYYLFVYAKTKLAKNHQSSSKKYKTTTYILALGCVVKTAAALLYTLVNYRPHVFPWVYYLCDTVAWAMLSIFFMSYASSSLISMSIHKQHKVVVDEELEKAMNEVGQKPYEGHSHHHHHHHHHHRRLRYPDE